MQASSSGPVARKLERTSVPGIFKRGNRYIVVFRDQTGAQRKRSARTLSEAKAIKAAATTDVRRGEYRTQSNVRFRDHYGPWIDTYQGRTSKGFRDTIRAEYRTDLEKHALPFFGPMKLAEIETAAHQGLAPRSRRTRACVGDDPLDLRATSGDARRLRRRRTDPLQPRRRRPDTQHRQAQRTEG